MFPPVFIRPRPTTILNTLDYFIMDLGEYGEFICTEPQVNNDYYMGLVRLVCNGGTSILDKLGTFDSLTRYHGLLTAYYLLYHRRDVGLAKAVLDRVIIEGSERDEECVFEILKHGVEGSLTREWLLGLDCGGWRRWGEWVRYLVLAHIDNANAVKYLGQVIEWVLMDLKMSIPKDSEFIRHYRIDPCRAWCEMGAPIHAFVYGTAERMLLRARLGLHQS
jgi:hypothetical protein